MPEILWLQTARADLLAIVDYISDDNPDAAQRVKDDIEEKVGTLARFPGMGRRGRVDGTRELVALSSYKSNPQLNIPMPARPTMPASNRRRRSRRLLAAHRLSAVRLGSEVDWMGSKRRLTSPESKIPKFAGFAALRKGV